MSPMLKDLQADIILPELKALTGKHVLQTLAAEIALRTNLDAGSIYTQLLEAEQKHASGVGGGVSIPHMQMEGLSEPMMILARLENPLDFNAADQQLVDLVFLLISPLEDGPLHLRRLSRISRFMANEKLCTQLRAARNIHEMRALLSNPESLLLAA